MPNLTGEHARKLGDEKIAAKISEGDDEMPAFKDKLTAQQIQDLVRFIRKEFRDDKKVQFQHLSYSGSRLNE